MDLKPRTLKQSIESLFGLKKDLDDNKVTNNAGEPSDIKSEFLAKDFKILEEDIQRKEALLNSLKQMPQASALSEEENHFLKPKDIISWVSSFDGLRNVRICVRVVEDVLSQMRTWIDKKCVLRMVLASRVTGQAKDVI